MNEEGRSTEGAFYLWTLQEIESVLVWREPPARVNEILGDSIIDTCSRRGGLTQPARLCVAGTGALEGVLRPLFCEDGGECHAVADERPARCARPEQSGCYRRLSIGNSYRLPPLIRQASSWARTYCGRRARWRRRRSATACRRRPARTSSPSAAATSTPCGRGARGRTWTTRWSSRGMARCARLLQTLDVEAAGLQVQRRRRS